MRKIAMILVVSLAALGTAAPAAARVVHRYKTEAEARKHCPRGEIVWGSSRGTYYPKESPLYGKSRGGAYVCAREAYAAGWRQDSD